jgi:hypothetical protein
VTTRCSRRKIKKRDDPGRYTVASFRYLPGALRVVRYAHSAPFTVTGRLGETHGGSVGRNPVIVKAEGTVMMLDPRAIVTLNGQRLYGPRDLAADDHTSEMRSWPGGVMTSAFSNPLSTDAGA